MTLATDTHSREPVPVGSVLAETVEEVVARAEADDAANRWFFNFGRQCGYRDGYEHGHADAHAEIEAAWSELAAKIRAGAHVPTMNELRQRRGEV